MFLSARFRMLVYGAVVAFMLAGCGGGGDSGGGAADRLRVENRELQSENERLQGEIEALQGQVAEADDEGTVADVDGPEETDSEEAEPSTDDDSEGGSGGANIQVAGEGDVSGKEVPEIMPEDFPLPSGAVLDYTNEGDYNFSLDFVLDSDLESLTTFYEDELESQGWKEVDRTEYERDGLEGVETSWEKGVYVPKGSPEDSDYEQTDQTLSLTLQEIQPSGSAGRLLWNSYKLLDESN